MSEIRQSSTFNAINELHICRSTKNNLIHSLKVKIQIEYVHMPVGRSITKITSFPSLIFVSMSQMYQTMNLIFVHSPRFTRWSRFD